jgi:nicotinamidase-related amidase
MKADAELKAPHPVSVNPANAALVVVNMQNDFCRVGGAIYDRRKLAQMENVIRSASDVVDRFRASGGRIVFVRSVRDLSAPQPRSFDEVPHVGAGTWGAELVEELRPEAGDVLIESWWPDPFYRSNLEGAVSFLGDPARNQILLVGGDIAGCLYFAAMGFYLRSYWTIACVDAIYGDEEGAAWAIAQFSKRSLPNVFLTRSDLVACTQVEEIGVSGLQPNT